MGHRHRTCWTLLLLGVLVGGVATPVAAADGGRLLGAVRDPGGQALAGVRMLLTDAHGAHEVVSNDDGHFRLDDLAPGNYTLTIDEPGFSPVTYEPVHVRLRRVTTVRVQLSPSVEETVVVTSEPPKPAATLVEHSERPEIERIAHDADPFRGAPAGAAVSGDPISASAATTPSPEPTADPAPRLEPLASTMLSRGGDLVATETGAIYETTLSGDIDLVTRRYDRPRGELAAAWGHLPDEDDFVAPGDGSAANDSTASPGVSLLRSTLEAGAEASGQLVADHAWLWGSHRRHELSRRAVGGLDEDLQLDTTAFELSSALRSTSLVLGYQRSQLEHLGAGAGPDRSSATTLGKDEPSAVWKLEGQQLVGRDLQLTVRLADSEQGRFHTPLGDATTGQDTPFFSPDGVWLGTFGELRYRGEQQLWQAEAERHLDRGKARHQVRFGLAEQRSDSTLAERWGNDDTIHVAGDSLGLPFDLVRALRPASRAVARRHFALWAGDTLTWGRLTLDLSLRHDRQTGRNLPGSVDAHPLFPDLLPGFEHSGSDAGFVWNTVLPRIASAWSLDGQGRTVLRASWSVYASRLDDDLVGRVSPGAPAELLLTFDDRDSDQRFDSGEPFALLAGQGIDVGRPWAASSHRNPASLEAEQTQELALGLEHAPNTRWTFQLDFLERRVGEALELRPQIRTPDGLVRSAQAADYLLDTILTGVLADGTPYSAPVYALRPGFEATGSNLLSNGDRRRVHQQVVVSAHRRLANRFELRSRVVWQDRRWELGEDFLRADDPTDIALGEASDAGIALADGGGDLAAPIVDGRVVDSRWAFELFARYRWGRDRPWGFDTALAISGREGHPLPYRTVVAASDGLLREVQLTPESDTYRLDDVVTADLRLEKDWTIGSGLVTLNLDVYNLFDARAVLDREGRVDSAQADAVRSTLHPRTFRLGLRLGW